MHQHGLRFWDRVFGWRRCTEARATLSHASDFLTPGTTALDIGCGIGYALDVVERDFGCTAYGCDVVEPPIKIDRFARFDGRALPYRDKAFDVAFLIFVLHHADDPGVLLREASRVTKRAVIVVEDTPNNPIERRWGSMHVHSFKTRHSIPWHGRVRDDHEWRQVFQFMGMPVLHAERLGRFERLPPVSRTCFVLSPTHAAQAAATRELRTATS
jgi:ubiquinone/menaquinone biosynthesis C-methylase UbiE